VDSVKTSKGTVFPLINLKGKKYLMVAYRLQWLNEESDNFSIETEFPLLTSDETIAKATITIFDKDGRVVKKASGTKRESKADFFDHTEKAETGACGRALASLGFGTQYALSDLDEGDRIVDSPLVDANAKTQTNVTTVSNTTTAQPSKVSSFRKPPVKKAEVRSEDDQASGWE
jgi:hypothetical protein